MWKYRSQTLISMIGLAVGFTCFALATLWVRYEMSYDSFHKNARQMYVIFIPNFSSPTGISRNSPAPLAAYLNETFPEIAQSAPVNPSNRRYNVTVEGTEFPVWVIMADTSFLQMFDVKILEGSPDFLVPGSTKIAITRSKARQLFGNENPIGKTVNDGVNEVCAIVSEMDKRSNFAFDMIMPFYSFYEEPSLNWNTTYGVNAVIELRPGTNIEAFEKKLYEHNTGKGRSNISKMTMKPITKVRYNDPEIIREVQFHHVLIFSVSGLFVILCALLNYFTLFVSRFRIRQKELALRIVCGASDGSLLAMLSVEFLLTLFISVLLGCLSTQSFYKPFISLSEISMSLPVIYRETLLYIGSIIIVSLILFQLILFIFRRRSLNMSIRRTNRNPFRKASVIVQIIISIGFTFCTGIILKQMYFLHHTDELGFSFQNRGTVIIRGEGLGGVIEDKLKQIPEITETVDATGMTNLLPQHMCGRESVSSWDDKPVDAEGFWIEYLFVSPAYIAYYDFRLLAGEMLAEGDPKSLMLLNESAVKAFGWHDAVGRSYYQYTVKGVIRDVYNLAPTVRPLPIYYTIYSGQTNETSNTILFKYREGSWKTCKEKIEQMIKKEFPDEKIPVIYNAEEVYNGFLTSENMLIKLLSIVTAICVLICVFGFVSLVSLTCEERRKAIAIRKINGATVGNILSMFAKEYALLLTIGATLAFSLAYPVMQRWLERYVKQTDIPAWVYLLILLVMAIVIVLCIGWQVYKTSVGNPAEVVKKE